MAGFAELIDGYHRFREGGWQTQRDRWAELATGQKPRVMVIACSDSRVDPSQIFDVSPGEIFVVRNVANLVPPLDLTPGFHGVSAALEFAVTQIEVEEIVVLGHGACGGCGAALSQRFHATQPGEGGFIANWIAMLDGAREKVVAEHGTEGPGATLAMEHEAVRISLANLRTFPCVRTREEEGRIKLHGAYFAIADGLLHVMDPASGAFAPA